MDAESEDRRPQSPRCPHRPQSRWWHGGSAGASPSRGEGQREWPSREAAAERSRRRRLPGGRGAAKRRQNIAGGVSRRNQEHPPSHSPEGGGRTDDVDCVDYMDAESDAQPPKGGDPARSPGRQPWDSVGASLQPPKRGGPSPPTGVGPAPRRRSSPRSGAEWGGRSPELRMVALGYGPGSPASRAVQGKGPGRPMDQRESRGDRQMALLVGSRLIPELINSGAHRAEGRCATCIPRVLEAPVPSPPSGGRVDMASGRT